MARYAIGDIHGCFETFERLLERISFDPTGDRLWLTGDLINGGPDSLRTLRWVVEHQENVDTVLGNHDLHMLAVASGARQMREKDTFSELLKAPDADELLAWLKAQPLVRKQEGYLMVHAALLPQWSAEDALRLSGEAQRMLRSDKAPDFFEHMYGNKPAHWREDLEGHDRLRVVVNAMTRLRTLARTGAMRFDFSGPLEALPAGHTPWFQTSRPAWRDHKVIFGHWSALGLHKVGPICALDSGCVWGGKLTALRLEDEAIFQVTSEMPKRI